jgi:hypothetical protein
MPDRLRQRSAAARARYAGGGDAGFAGGVKPHIKQFKARQLPISNSATKPGHHFIGSNLAFAMTSHSVRHLNRPSLGLATIKPPMAYFRPTSYFSSR